MSRMSRLFFVTISVLLASPALITHPAPQTPLGFTSPLLAPKSGEAIALSKDKPVAVVLPDWDARATANDKEAFSRAEQLFNAGELEEAHAAGLNTLASYPFSDYGYQLMHRIAVAGEDSSDALR